MGAGHTDNDFASETYRRSQVQHHGQTVYSYAVIRHGDPTLYRGKVACQPRNLAPASHRWVATDGNGRTGFGPRRDKAIADLLS